MHRIILAIILSLFTITNSYATKQASIVIGVDNLHNFPLYYTDEQGEFKGFYRNIFDKFAKDSGIKVEYKPMTINQLFQALYNKEIDFKFPDNPVWRASDKRSYDVVYSNHIYPFLEGMFVLKDNIGKGLKDINKIGIIGNVAPWYIHHPLEINKMKAKKGLDCNYLMNKLLSQKLDAVICNYAVAKLAMKELDAQSKIYFDVSLPFINDYFYISTISKPEIVKKFDLWLDRNEEFLQSEAENLQSAILDL